MLAATVAMAPPSESRAQRGNDAIERRRGPIFTLGAQPRLGVLLAGGADVIQPVGFGAGLQFRVHGLHVGPLRFGGELQLGHTRYLERRTVTSNTTGSPMSATRYAALGHTDFALGPSLQLKLGPVFLEGGFGAGLGISTFVRPRGALQADEEDYTDVTAMIRGGGHLGVPIRNNQGVTIGTAVQKFFSQRQIVADPPDDPEADAGEPDVNPFDLMLEIYVGYFFMF